MTIGIGVGTGNVLNNLRQTLPEELPGCGADAVHVDIFTVARHKEKKLLVVNTGTGAASVGGKASGGVGNNRAVFRSRHHRAINRNLVIDTGGNSLCLGCNRSLNLPQEVTAFAGAFFLFQLVNALAKFGDLFFQFCQLGNTIATAATAPGRRAAATAAALTSTAGDGATAG